MLNTDVIRVKKVKFSKSEMYFQINSFMHVKNRLFVFVGLKPFRPVQTIAGLWDVG